MDGWPGRISDIGPYMITNDVKKSIQHLKCRWFFFSRIFSRHQTTLGML